MNALSLSLFGRFQAMLNGEPLGGFRTAKVQALLIYLAADSTTPQRRESLMTLLWPGMPERSARQNLRQIIYNLRRAIPELPQKSVDGEIAGDTVVPLLLANRHTIQLNPLADVSSDAARFESLIASTQTHDHLDILLCQECRQNLETAVALYKGDFLADFYLDDSNAYEEWAEVKRQRYRRQALDALETLTTIATREAAYGDARSYAEQQLEIDHLRESGYRQLMKIMALNGQRSEALAVYESLGRLLAEELGMAPAARTTELYEQIRAGDLNFTRPAARGVRGLELKEKIGQGSYGVVHRAVQPAVSREVAVKVIRRKYADDPEFIRRFEAEAQVIARLEHPYIVPLYDYWREPDGAYLVMRLLRGGNLLASLEGGPWDVEQTIKLVDQVTSALAVAHRQGVVHRDIKPANILLDEAGNAYLSDFGIAKQMAGDLHLTAAGAIMGTPDYISPEQLRDEAVGPPSDIYSLGAVLYETLTGERPFPDVPVAMIIQKQLQDPIPLVSASRPDLPRQIDVVIQRATAKQPADRYDNALALAEAFRQAARGADGGQPIVVDAGDPAGFPVTVPAVVDVINPYKGLRAFQETDAADFFGREKLVEQLVDRFCDSRFVAVVGPSGSGKSSVVKAGLIPALREGAIKGAEKWFIAEMVPGSHPLEELELALLPVAVDPPPDLVEPMQKDRRGMLRTIRRILPAEDGAELLLVIDQFEELFTLVEDEERRTFFLDSLLAAVTAPHSPLRVAITLRADFYDRPLQVQPLGQWIKENTEVVLPMTADELAWAVQEPARRAGVGIEDGLTPAIVAGVVNEPGALPLLQYAMTELFDDRQNGLMTRAAYEEIGGVLGALGRRAEEIYESLDPAGQEAARQMFLRLVTLGEGVEDTRRRVLREELEGISELSTVNSEQSMINDQQSTINDQSQIRDPTSEIRHPVDSALRTAHSALDSVPNSEFRIPHLIDLFGQYRLLTFDHDPQTRGATVEVAHEALLREWPRLREWLDESRAEVRLLRLLAAETAEWQKARKGETYLLRGARLDQYNSWPEEATVSLTEAEKVFLAASFAARDRRRSEEEARAQRELETAQQLAETEKQRAEEQTEAAAGLRRRAVILAGAMGIAAILAVAALFFARQSSEHAQSAEEQAALAATSEQQAVTEADARATAQITAEENEQLAIAAAATADAAAIAEAQAADDARAAQGIAEEQRALAEQEQLKAEEQARLATSRELAAASLANLDKDPELSILLAMEALSATYTAEAEDALHQAVQHSRVRRRLESDPAEGLLPTHWLTISPDGQNMFTSGSGGGILWDMETGEIVDTFTAERLADYLPDEEQIDSWYINRADFSPDGSLLALPIEAVIGNESAPGYVIILDAKTGQELLAFLAFDDSGVQDLTFNHDGTQLAGTGGWNGQTIIWDVAATLAAGTSQQLATYCCQGDWAYSVNYNPDGSLIVSTGNDGTTKVWDVANGTELLSISDYSGSDAVFSPDGQYVIVTDDENMVVFETASGEFISSVPGPGSTIAEMLFSPDGKRLAASSFDGPVWIWKYANGNLDQDPLILAGHKGQVVGVSFTPDGRLLASGGVDMTSRLWDVSVEGGSEFGAFAHGSNVPDVAFSSDGSWLVSTSEDGSAKIWDVVANEERFTLLGHEDTVIEAEIHPDGRTLATASDDGTVRIWDAQTGEEKLVIQPDVDILLPVKGLSYSPDGQRLVVGGDDKVARVWDPTTGELLYELIGHPDRIEAARFSPDGRWLITFGREEGAIKLWDPIDGRDLGNLSGDGTTVWEAAFSPDGSRLVTSHNSGNAIVWSIPDLEAGPDTWPEKLYEIQHNPGWVGKGAFSPDGKLLAVGGGNQSSLYDAVTGERLIDFGRLGMMAEFSPDGRIIAVAGFDGIVRLLIVHQDDLRALAESRVTRSLTEEECQQYLHADTCPQ